MSKTKSVRVLIDDAVALERAARELSVELDRIVKVSEIIKELTKDVDGAKQRIKKGAEKIS